MSFGTILRAEREKRGLTEHQVAEATHMMVQIVCELENEDFHRISAPIYGRGFVKLYAELLELDPAPLIKDFNELYAQKSNEPALPSLPARRPPPPKKPEVQPVPAETAPPLASSEPAKTAAPLPIDTVAKDLLGDPLPPPTAAGDGAKSDTSDPGEAEQAPEADKPRATGGFPHAVTKSLDQEHKPMTRRSVLDGSTQRFEGKPFKPSAAGLVMVRIASFFGWIFKGVAFVVCGIGAGLRYMARTFARIVTLLSRYVVAAGVWLWRLLRSGLTSPRLRASAPLILKIAIPAIVAIVLLSFAVSGIRSYRVKAAQRSAEASALAAEGTVVIERVLPPPAGYAD